MYDFIKIACVVPKIDPADVKGNTEKIINTLLECEKENTDAAVFPELCISGYTCADLFYQDTLIRKVKKAIPKICEATLNCGFVSAIGAPVMISGQLYNCGLIIYRGKVYGCCVKTYIPTYNEFYEKRWFSSSMDLRTDTIMSSALGLDEEYEIPVGKDLIFECSSGLKFSAEICEDIWAPISPSAYHTLAGAELVMNLSASNETISKRTYRRDLIRQTSASDICIYAYTSSGCSESTTDLIFSGHTLVCENGSKRAENDVNADGEHITYAVCDLGKIRADRAKIKTFKDCVSNNIGMGDFRTVYIKTEGELRADLKNQKIDKYPFVPSDETLRRERCSEIFRMQACALKKRLDITGARPVVGVSGGLDSTLALLVCSKALELSGRPASDAVGITMPCFGTTDRTHSNSLKLMETLGIESVEINIKDAVNMHFRDIGHDGVTTDLTYENSQARERTQILMDYAGKIGGLVVGTGDLSELALGWCTYNADHMSMYGVNSGVPKTLVKWMIESTVKNNVFPRSTSVLCDIIDTPISPELLPPDSDGTISQVTEDLVGPYVLHDFYLYYAVRFGFSPKKIYYLAKKAFDGEFDEETILKWLKNFYRRFFTQQFKRSCLPDGVKIGSICLSPRGDWRMPSDASAKIWLDEAESIVVEK